MSRRLVLLIVVLLAIAGLAVARLGSWQSVRWGVVSELDEDFTSATWRDRWQAVGGGGFEQRDKSLVTTGPNDSLLMYRQRLPAAVAMEYTALTPRDGAHGDISAVFTEDDPFVPGLRSVFGLGARTVFFQVGMDDNTGCAIRVRTRSGAIETLALSSFRIEPGQPHTIRVELDGADLRLLIDGELVCSHQELLPLDSGHIGVFGYYPGQVFDRIRLWRRAETDVGPLVHGDVLWRYGHVEEAAQEYQALAAASPSASVVDEARYRQAACLVELGDERGALFLLQDLTAASHVGRAEQLRIHLDVAAGRLADAERRIRSLWHNDAERRPALVRQWVTGLSAVSPNEFDGWLGIMTELFADDLIAQRAVARPLEQAGRFEDMLSVCAQDYHARATALHALGRPEEVLEHSPLPQERARALLSLGEFDRLGREYPFVLWVDDEVRPMRDVPPPWDEAEATATPPARLDEFQQMLWYLRRGRLDAAETLRPNDARVLMARGELDSLLGGSGRVAREARFIALMTAAADGSTVVVKDHVAALESGWSDRSWWPLWFSEDVVWPLLPFLLGEQDADQARLAWDAHILDHQDEWARRAWHLHQLATGREEVADFLAQPAAGRNEALLALGLGLRAELVGDRDQALLHYKTYDELGPGRQVVDFGAPNPGIAAFVTWRRAELDR
ncbi:MAG: hypothetical protein PF961_01690 [Planctomycetota bacterium]|jgi:hypothetical protein|nr:hypothetical protein [Planctomycetota bacterium]